MRDSKTRRDFTEALRIIAEVQQKPELLDVVYFLLRLATRNPRDLISAYKDTVSEFRCRILKLLCEGERIKAIKLYWSEMRVSLKEAKEAVDKIARDSGILLPPASEEEES